MPMNIKNFKEIHLRLDFYSQIMPHPKWGIVTGDGWQFL
jgi:hypothetical protein